MSETVSFPHNDGDASGYLAVPESGSGPGVLVIQEWWGVAPQLKRTADRLAAAGFVALIPDLYHGELAGHDEMDKAAELMSKLPPGQAAEEMSDAVDYLLSRDETVGDSVGVMGFCMGGMLTWLIAARRGDVVRAAVPFYGYPSGDAVPDWSSLTAVVRGHMATQDDFFPVDGARALQADLVAMGKDVELTFHDGGHAFMNEDDPFGIYDAELAAEVWTEAVSFLKSALA